MKRRALITGITGQDGSYLAEFLLDKGYEVWGMVRRSSTDPFQRINHIKNKLNLRYGNLLDAYSIKNILKESKPHEIYNLASQSDVPVSVACPNETNEINYYGVGRIINGVKDLNLNSKIYQASSSEMFGNVDIKIINEETTFNPQSPYAEAKLKAHQDFVVNYREKYGMFICSGFMFNHESPRRGKHFVTKKITHSMAKIKLGLQDNFSLGNLDAKRDWGFSKDYIKAMWMMLQQKKPDDYVIATGESHTVRDFINETGKCLGMLIKWEGSGIDEVGLWNGKPIISIDKKFFRLKEVHKLCGDATKAKKELGWEPEIKFKDLVKIMVKYDLKLVQKEMPIDFSKIKERLKMPLSEIIDRYTITLLKSKRTDEDVSIELETYKKEIEKYGDKKLINNFIDKLYKVNGDLWATEQLIGRDQKKIPPLEIVGKIALEVRKINKIRNGIKAEIVDTFAEGFKEIKVNYTKV